MVPFTPRLIPVILPNLAHHVNMIQSVAIRTNKLLLNVIQTLPPPPEALPRPPVLEKQSSSRIPPVPGSPTPTTATNSRQTTLSSSRELSSPESTQDQAPASIYSQRTRGSVVDLTARAAAAPPDAPAINPPSRSNSPIQLAGQGGYLPNQGAAPQNTDGEGEQFNYQETVNELTLHFMSEFEDTRVAALKWLIMLHQKAPKKVDPRYVCLVF